MKNPSGQQKRNSSPKCETYLIPDSDVFPYFFMMSNVELLTACHRTDDEQGLFSFPDGFW